MAWGLNPGSKPFTNVSCQSPEWNPQGARRKGRPKRLWGRTIQKEYEAIGVTLNEVMRMTQNQVLWRVTVEALCSSRSMVGGGGG